MKPNRNIALWILPVLLAGLFHTCSRDSSSPLDADSNPTGSVAPKIRFMHQSTKIRFPSGVAYVTLKVGNPDQGFDTTATFAYIAKSGEISGVPIGEIDMGVGGLDVEGDTIYWGETTGVALEEGTPITPVVEIQETPPIAPYNLMATVVSPSQVQLSWKDNSSNEDGFDAVINGEVDTTFTANSNDTTMQITGLNPATEYNFEVKAYNSGGYSHPSNQVTVTTDSLVENDAIPPFISIEKPDSGHTTTSNVVNVEVLATDSNGINRVTVNGWNANLLDDNNWYVRLVLEQLGSNTIIATATDNSQSANQAHDTIVIEYDTTVVDTFPPTLVIDNVPDIHNKPNWTITGSAEDSLGNVVQVFVDSSNQVNTTDNWMNWSHEKVLKLGPNEIVVLAVDQDNNFTAETLYIHYDSTADSTSNILPEFSTKTSDMQTKAIVGTEYRDTVGASDKNKDTLTMSFITRPNATMMLTDSIVTWTPTMADTGDNGCALRVSDGQGGYDTLYWTVTVTLSGVDDTTGMRQIPSGSFTDGDNRTATVTSFYMDSIETTLEMYLQYDAGHAQSHTGNGQFPVDSVAWYQAIMFANWRSKLNGLDTCYSYTAINSTGATGLTCHFEKNGFRLPTEDEWEIAARGKENTTYATNDGSIGISKANYANNVGKTVPVAHYEPNTHGLYQMSGNVREWCWDEYASGVRGNGRRNYTGPTSGSGRVLKGGGFNDPEASCKTTWRSEGTPGSSASNIGFRLVRSFNLTPNRTPSFISTSDSMTDSAVVGSLYVDIVEALEPDGDAVVFQMVRGPGGMQLDTLTGIITWTPTIDDTGSQLCSAHVSDGNRAGYGIMSWRVFVSDSNLAPTINRDSTVLGATITIGSPYRDTVYANDPDGDVVTIDFASRASENMTLTSNILTWTPVAADAGSNAFEIYVSDGRGKTDSLAFTIIVLAPAAASDLIAYYEFNDDPNDAGVNAYHGSVSGSVSGTEDRFNNTQSAYHFDGATDVFTANLPSTPGIRSISMWLKPTGSMQNNVAALIGSSHDNGVMLWHNGEGEFEARYNTGSDVWKLETMNSLTVGEWTHVVLCMGTNGAHLYLNKASIDYHESTNIMTDATLRVGRAQPLSGLNAFDGAIDEVRIYGATLSKSQIDSLYHLQGWGTALDSGMVAAYGLNGDANDQSVNANHGSFIGAPTPTSDRFESAGKALDFDGADDCIDCGDLGITGNQITISAWAKINSMPATFGMIVTKDGNYELGVHNAKVYFRIEDNYLDTENSTIAVNQQYHLVGVYDGSTRKVYINGVLDAQASQTDSFRILSHATSVGCRSYQSSFHLDAVIDDIVIYNRALTSAEIQALYSDRGWTGN